jgi:hypothetical protein
MSIEENLEEDKTPKALATWDDFKIGILLDECVSCNITKTNDGTGFKSQVWNTITINFNSNANVNYTILQIQSKYFYSYIWSVIL